MNKVIMMGRLTKEPEVRYSQGGQAVAKMSVAVDRRFKRDDGPGADFFNCTAFGKTAEFIEKYLKKGSKIVFDGSLQNNNYTDKNGVQRYDVQIMIDNVEFAESKASQIGNNNNTPGDGFMQIPDGIDEELPFV